MLVPDGVALHPEVDAAFARAVRIASTRYGAAPSISFEMLDACYAMADVFSKVEAATLHGPWMRAHPQAYSQAVYSRTEPGLHVPAVRYLEALTVRARILTDFVRGPLGQVDVLLLPTMPVLVPTRSEADVEAPGSVFGVVAALTALTRPFNYLGVPVLNMPIELDSHGMPIGMQLVGRPLGEARLLAMAAALSSDLGWTPLTQGRHPPREPYDDPCLLPCFAHSLCARKSRHRCGHALPCPSPLGRLPVRRGPCRARARQVRALHGLWQPNRRGGDRRSEIHGR